MYMDSDGVALHSQYGLVSPGPHVNVVISCTHENKNYGSFRIIVVMSLVVLKK